MVDDLNLCTRWGELLQTLSSNLRTRLEKMPATKSGLSKSITSNQGAPGTQFSTSDRSFLESSVNPSFGLSQQNVNTAGNNLDNCDIFNTNNFSSLEANPGNMEINGCAPSWDDLSLWLDPLENVPAANISQMPWHGDQGMYGMLEPFMGGSGDCYNPGT